MRDFINVMAQILGCAILGCAICAMLVFAITLLMM